uniref:Peptidase metallopeptidase domain-containing protein n=1 Tax=Amazona collaria TaxID=241587 RepID=A0A8B9GFX9_9PSIT
SNMRQKRYTLMGLKPRQLCTPSIQNYTEKLGWYHSHKAIRRVFWVWEQAAPLVFWEVPFQQKRKESNIDSSPFDGIGCGGGDTHFDLDEPWTLENMSGELRAKEHSSNPSAIMAPFYQWMDMENLQLPKDDLKGIQQLYGTMDGHPQPTKPLPTVTPRGPVPDKMPGTGAGLYVLPILCQHPVSHQGWWFWRVQHNRVMDNYPMPIGHFWWGLHGDINAAYERHDGRLVFFKGEQGSDPYWLFQEANLEPRYPQLLVTYGQGIPYNSIDTAVWWEPTGHTFFLQGDRYWRFNEDTHSMDNGYPKTISIWVGIPPSPKGDFLSPDTCNYPKSILWDFMGCHTQLDYGKGGHQPGGDMDILVQINKYTPHHIMNCQKVKSNMPCLLMGSVALWESIVDGRQLYGVLDDKLQKLLKERVNRVSLQR